MDKAMIRLTVLWMALMFAYLLGDILRVYSGDIKPGEILGKPGSQAMYLGIALFMSIPIVMMILTVTLDYPINRWLNIVVACLLFIFNALGLPGYTSWYDKFLIIVGLIINGITVWFAWSWNQ